MVAGSISGEATAGASDAASSSLLGSLPAEAAIAVVARDVAGFLDFASDFAPDQLSDSGKLASFQNGAPNTLCFPWKFPETQSAGDPLFSFLFAGKACAGQ